VRNREIPKHPHYAVVVVTKGSVHVPGDERSRTNPGHGYPAHDVDYHDVEYIPFENTEAGHAEWKKELKRRFLSESTGTVIGLHVDRVAVPKIEMKIVVAGDGGGAP